MYYHMIFVISITDPLLATATF